MMVRTWGRAFAAVVATAALAAAATPANAASLSLSVVPLVVEFHLAPGQSGSTPVVVANPGLETERIVVQTIDWRTMLDGTLRLERPGAEGGSSLADRLRLSANEFVLGPGQQRTLSLALDIPATFPKTSAVYWSGFMLRALPLQGGNAAFGPAATIVVYDTVGTPRTHADMKQLNVSGDKGGIARIRMRMVNDAVGYVRPTIRSVVAQNGRVVQDLTDNTAVVFGGASRVYTKELSGLQPGRYQLDMTIDYGGPTLIEGSTAFTVP